MFGGCSLIWMYTETFMDKSYNQKVLMPQGHSLRIYSIGGTVEKKSCVVQASLQDVLWVRRVYKMMYVGQVRQMSSLTYNTELLRSLGDEVGILIDQDNVCLLPIGSKGIDTPED